MYTQIIKIDRGKREDLKDIVTEEIPLTLYLNDKEFVTLLCSPEGLDELSVGFLFSAGLIRSVDDIEKITIDKQNWTSHIELKNKDVASQFVFKRLYTSGCGKGTIFYNVLDMAHKGKITGERKISSEKLGAIMHTFQRQSTLYRETGGVHSAALSTPETIMIFKEDIGRHNAIDKVTGHALIKGIEMKDSLILTSGRISSEIVFKVQKMRSAFLVSRSAPTDQAVRLATDLNLTLVGFMRGPRMNVYSGSHRIT